jgi:two-component system cell cycle response regulator
MTMRILIAEDDSTSRTILAGVLKKSGHEVLVTVNGAEAWQAMQKPDAPGLVVLDWIMPEMNGPDIVRLIRAMPSDRPPYIIMLTSKSEKADIIAGLDAGADDYLAKPFDPGELRARIEVGRRMLELQATLLAANIALAHEATHDPLTGIYNRRAIMEAMSREISREQRQQSGLAIGMCDIDYFKKINDVHGHQVGDEVLCGVVRLLEKCLRQYDSVGRYGGEEFIVITPAVKEGDAGAIYERFRAAVADNPIVTMACDIPITLSIGVAVCGQSDKVDELLAAADTALYQAKNGGRNRVCLAKPGNIKVK